MNYLKFINHTMNSTAETRFKNLVLHTLDAGLYPSAINLGKVGAHNRNDLNGRECRWRREICAKAGFKLKGSNFDGD